MDTAGYFNAIEERLLSDHLIAAVEFVDRWQTDVNGYFRARLTFANGQRLEFAEYIQRAKSSRIEVVTYAYQWMTADGSLLCRWDNTPHYPSLLGFPCHRHDGSEANAQADEPRDVIAVLSEIARRLG